MIALLIQSTGEAFPLTGLVDLSDERGGRYTQQPVDDGSLISDYYQRNAEIFQLSITSNEEDAASMLERLEALRGREIVDLQWPGWAPERNLGIERVGRGVGPMDGATYTVTLVRLSYASTRTEQREAPQPREEIAPGQADEIEKGPRSATAVDVPDLDVSLFKSAVNTATGGG